MLTDVRVLDVEVEFRHVPLDHALQLSGGAIHGYTLAIATVAVVGAGGLAARGRGAGVLSIPWAWPVSTLSIPKRDAVLRALTLRCSDLFKGMGPTDPLTIYDEAIKHVPFLVRDIADAEGITEHIPGLATVLALAAVDNGVHDAWARAAGRSAYKLYTREHVRADTDVVSPDFRRRLPIQHVVGLADPLTAGDRTGSESSLEDWIRRDGIAHVKVKISGKDPDADAERIAAVHAVMPEGARSNGSISLDANEGFADIPALIEMLDRLESRHPKALRRLAYVEQPVPRDHVPDRFAMGVAGLRIPVLVDEGLSASSDLPRIAAEGWTGIVVKAARGQSLSVRSHAFARSHDWWVTLQDLTAVDLALEHSARLAGALTWSSPAFEFNSRQYAPRSNAALLRRRPGLVRVVDGNVSIALPPRPGIY